MGIHNSILAEMDIFIYDYEPGVDLPVPGLNSTLKKRRQPRMKE